MPKSSCLKWIYWRFGIDNRIVLLFTRFLNAKGIIPESLKSIGQFYQAQINEKTELSRTFGTDLNYKKVSLLKTRALIYKPTQLRKQTDKQPVFFMKVGMQYLTEGISEITSWWKESLQITQTEIGINSNSKYLLTLSPLITMADKCWNIYLIDFSLQWQVPSSSQTPDVCPRSTHPAVHTGLPKVHLRCLNQHFMYNFLNKTDTNF